jgi:dihydroflavonol-4-reductase
MILVTGGTGMLGAHLIEELYLQGKAVRAIYRTKIPASIAGYASWVQADLLDIISLEAALQGITQVYNCAGFVSFAAKDKATLHQINVEGTANIVNACLDANIEKLVHVSSVAALGRIRQGQIIDENMAWSEETSNSEYGKTKYLGEMEVWRGIGEGLNAVIVNPSIILGKHGDWEKGSMALFKKVYSQFPWYSGGGTGWVDAQDVCQAMVQLMHSNISAQKYVVSGHNAGYKEVFCTIADGFGTKRPSKLVTPLLAAIVWRLEKVKSFITNTTPLITKETAATALVFANFDNTKLLKALPNFKYQPLATSILRICNELKIKYNL